ncbi:MAG: 2-oxoacid:acceptor oxidoreductase subunit alpha [Spirochaetes bacterium]|nr:2-oxoacid:acceptor oxidoreductase subunit alpha [Spirochaetota bacterium]
MSKIQFKNDISVVISGSAGQGLQTLEQLLLKIMKTSGFHVFAYSEFMSRIRGGNNSTEIRISNKRVASFVDRIDILFPIEEGSMPRLRSRITKDTLIIGRDKYIESSYKNGKYNIVLLADELSEKDSGKQIIMNIMIFGIITALTGIDINTASGFLKTYFKKLTEEKIADNIYSLNKAYEYTEVNLRPRISYPLVKHGKAFRSEILLYGSDAVSIGALAGGCSFVSSYPMSPSTGVLVYMAQKAEDSGIVVEQAEDEISAVNMAIGAWYAGARAMVTTSGGGFALMTEGLSLAGAIESPIVIHLAQRPGPATGLPTRTEQADLLMALYAGHGEFPRVILSPGTKDEAVTLACNAFNIADKYQVPVFILTDQYFLDSANNLSLIDFSKLKEKKYFIKTAPGYKRHSFTKNGISPRGIPGYGTGIVCADSDEHDEADYITEDPDTRMRMVNKRLKKLSAMTGDTIQPKLTGSKKYKYLIVGWGSTSGTINEAIKLIGNNDLAFLHFNQLYPLPDKTMSLLKKAKKTIILEQNATSQFAKIIRSETGHVFDYSILKYDGMPFSVEEIVKKIKKCIK